MGTATKIVAWVMGGFLALTILGSVTGVLSTIITAPGRVINKTLETDNILYNYEWFKRQYHEVLGMERRLLVAEAEREIFEQVLKNIPRDKISFEDKQEQARLSSIVMGLTGQIAAMKEEYNARSKMMNRSIFKLGDIPEQL